MRATVTSWVVSVCAHLAVIAFLLLGFPFFQKPIQAEEKFQGVEVLLLAAAPPPEPQVVHVPPPPPPPPPPPETDPITSTSDEPDLEPAPPPKPKPVVRRPVPTPPPPPQPPKEQPKVEMPPQPAYQPPQQVAAATPAPVSSAPRAPVNPNAEASYYAQLLAWLEKNKEYPRRAQLRRMEGVAHLRFVIDENGRVISHRIERSSGHETLDNAVERMIAKASPLPPIPPALGKSRLDLVVPVQFFLK